jgi:hypothetical protein
MSLPEMYLRFDLRIRKGKGVSAYEVDQVNESQIWLLSRLVLHLEYNSNSQRLSGEQESLSGITDLVTSCPYGYLGLIEQKI